MPDTQQQFDGQNPVSGYTLFHGKDGQNFYLKGENLADDEIKSRVAKLRGQNTQTPTPAETQFEEDIKSNQGVTSPYDPNAHGVAQRFLGSAGAQLLSTPGMLVKAAMDPVGTAKDIATGVGSSLKAWADPATRPTWEGIKSVLPEALGGGFGAVASGYGPEAARGVAEMASPYKPQIVNAVGALEHPLQVPGKIAKTIVGKMIPDAPAPPAPKLGSPENPGWMSKLPTRLPPNLRSDPFAPSSTAAELGSPDNPGFMSKLPTRLPPSLRGDPFAPPIEETAEAGRQAAAASPSGVIVVPEPKPLFPGQNENYAASMPRNELEPLAQAGQPGAAKQLQQLGRKVIFSPPGAGIETASMDALRQSLGITQSMPQGNPDPFSPYSPAMPQSNPSPYSPAPSATDGWFRPTASRSTSPVFVPADQAMALRRSKTAPNTW
jgi:hypothetical protein